MEQVGDFPELSAAALQRARTIAPGMPQLLLVDAGDLQSQGDWVGADALYRQILNLHPALAASANMSYGNMLQWAGRAQDALPCQLRAARLAPQSANNAFFMANT